MKDFGEHIRAKRIRLREADPSYSLRQVSQRIGIEPSYLSKIERGQPVALSEEKIIALAEDIDEDPDYLLALGGKISGDVQEIIKKRPMLFSHVVREMASLPDEAIEAENEFKRIQGRMHRLHDLASIGAFQFSDVPDGSYWSQQIPTILRLPQDAEPSGESLLRAIAPEERERFTRVAGEALENERTFQCELQLADDDDGPRYIRVWGYFEPAADASGVARLGIIQDVTEFVRLRNDIKAARAALQATVHDQGIELAEAIGNLKEEISSRRKLEAELSRMNEGILAQAAMQSAFFKEKAFSLRSLMNRFVAENVLSQEGSDTRTFKRLSAKINDMGDFFGSAGGLKPELEGFGVQDVLASVVGEFEAEFQQANLTLHFIAAPGLPRIVQADRRRFEQVAIALLELYLVNTPWGHVQVSASADAAREHLVLSILSPSRHRRVAGEDFQLGQGGKGGPYESNPAQFVGTLMEAVKGAFHFDNPEGGGVVVSVHIPMTPAQEAPEPVEQPNPDKVVLVVEDEKFSRIYITRSLEKMGYEVHVAINGQEALKEAASRKFNSILLDIQLSDIDGTEIARSIRGDAASPNQATPMIAVTAHATQADRESYRAAGINGFIAKPFEPAALTAELSRHSE